MGNPARATRSVGNGPQLPESIKGDSLRKLGIN